MVRYTDPWSLLLWLAAGVAIALAVALARGC